MMENKKLIFQLTFRTHTHTLILKVRMVQMEVECGHHLLSTPGAHLLDLLFNRFRKHFTIDA